RGRVSTSGSDAPCGAEPGTGRWERKRREHDTTFQLWSQSEEEKAHRRVFRLAEDGRPAAQSAASRSVQSGLDLHLRLRSLQPGAHAKPCGSPSAVSPDGRVSPPGHGVRPKKLTNTRNQPAQQSQTMRIRKTTELQINSS